MKKSEESRRNISSPEGRLDGLPSNETACMFIQEPVCMRYKWSTDFVFFYGSVGKTLLPTGYTHFWTPLRATEYSTRSEIIRIKCTFSLRLLRSRASKTIPRSWYVIPYASVPVTFINMRPYGCCTWLWFHDVECDVNPITTTIIDNGGRHSDEYIYSCFSRRSIYEPSQVNQNVRRNLLLVGNSRWRFLKRLFAAAPRRTTRGALWFSIARHGSVAHLGRLGHADDHSNANETHRRK